MTRFFIGVLAMLLLGSCSNTNKETIAEINTSMGVIKVKLYNSTPKHRDNFIELAGEGFYDSLLFHRVMNGFMIQGGDPESRNATPNQALGNGGPGYKVDAEIGAPHFKGALAAARQNDQVNPERQSSGSQFYIVHGQPVSAEMLEAYGKRKGIVYTDEQKQIYEQLGGRPDLDMDYTVFGEVIEGLEVVDKIAAVTTGPGNRPLEPVRMSIKILN